MTTDNEKAPEWMTDEWLASAKLLTDSPTWGWSKVADMAREILRLRAELAKVTAFIASLPNLKEAGEMCKQAAVELATLTAELATLREHADHDAGEILRLGGELADIKACDGPIAQAEAYGESMRHENDGLRAAIRDRNEFAASEVTKLATKIGAETGLDLSDFASDHVAELRRDGQWGDDQVRAAELRKAAPSTEGQPSILPLVRADGRTLRVGAIAGGAHPDDRRDGFPAELRLELGDDAGRHSCRYVRQAEGVSAGVSAGRCKAAGAAAPVEFATTTTPGAFAFLANEPDVYATPAADARQPAGDSTRCRMIAQTIIAAIGSAGPENVEQSVDRLLRYLSETEKREADGIKLFDDLLATERAKVATMTIELDGMRNRIAASEKAKVDQVVLVMNLRRALGMVRAKVGRVLGPQWEDNGHVGQVIRAAVELCDAAERAGGAS